MYVHDVFLFFVQHENDLKNRGIKKNEKLTEQNKLKIQKDTDNQIAIK